MNSRNKLIAFLNTRTAFYLVLVICAASSFSTFWYGHVTGFSDEGHYWGLATGMHHGKFSAWYFLPVNTPDTLRTWGYPFFLYLCQFVSPTYSFVHFVQLVLFVLTIGMCLRIIRHFYAPLAYRTFFLLLLVFNNHLAFYAGVLIAESVFIFFITLFVFIYLFYRDTYRKYFLMAVICFILYQLRPIFLLFPLLFFLYLVFKRKPLKPNLIFFSIFFLLLLPFGFWNKSSHGVFKVTPLEGGIGAMYQSGYWDYRLPVGFQAPYYWGMYVDDDVLQPGFLSNEEQQKEALRYVREWETLLNSLKQNYYTREDSLRDMYMRDPKYTYLHLFLIYGSGYTLAREKLLKEKLVNEIKTHPGFYLKTRIYNFFRQWVTGINMSQLKGNPGLAGYVKALYPFLITFVFILCGLIWITIQLIRRKLSWKKFDVFFLLIGYFAVVNVPFGVMSRYTVPVHLFILMMLSVCFVNLLNRNRDDTNKKVVV